MRSLDILLLHRSKGDEAHVRTLGGFTKGFRIVAVILIPLDEGFYILRTDHTDAVTELLKGSGSVEGSRAGLNHGQAGLRVGDDRQ